jgi:hypothetical protein
MGPIQHRVARKFLAGVGSDHSRVAAERAKLVEDPGEMVPPNISLDDDSHSLMRGVIDHGQALDRAAGCVTIKLEVH